MKKHTDALVAIIKSIPNLAATTYVSRAFNADKSPVKLPYVVIHPSDGSDQSDRLTGPSVVQHPRFVIHSVGLDYAGAQFTAEAVKAKLIVGGFGVVPTITGEVAGAFWYESPQPIQMDTDASPPYLWHTAECGFESTPA